jgi:nucleoside-diphosphate-sugar epimerase
LSIAVANCLDTPKTVRACYNLSGAEPLSFNHLVETICDALRSSVRLIHFPMGLPVAALRFAERFPWRLSLRSEQLLRLNEDKAFSHERARDDFGFAPLPFSAGVALQIREMGLMPEPQVTASSSSH